MVIGIAYEKCESNIALPQKSGQSIVMSYQQY